MNLSYIFRCLNFPTNTPNMHHLSKQCSFLQGRISIYWPQNLRRTLDTPKFWHYVSPSFQQILSIPYPPPQMLVGLHNQEFLTTHFVSPSFVALLQPTRYNHDSQQNEYSKSLQLGIKFHQKIHIFWCFKVLGYLSVHTTIQKFLKLKFWRPKNWFLS